MTINDSELDQACKNLVIALCQLAKSYIEIGTIASNTSKYIFLSREIELKLDHVLGKRGIYRKTVD